MNVSLRFWEWIDSRGIVRRVSLGFTFYMTYVSFKWAIEYAAASKLPGLEVAAVVAAVLAPISYLQKAVFEAYIGSRGKESTNA